VMRTPCVQRHPEVVALVEEALGTGPAVHSQVTGVAAQVSRGLVWLSTCTSMIPPVGSTVGYRQKGCVLGKGPGRERAG
jgi:hypothetical protein